MNWRERQALPGPRTRFFFASVVPQIVEVDGKPQLVWPRKGSRANLMYRKYEFDRRVERDIRPDLSKFSNVDDPVAA